MKNSSEFLDLLENYFTVYLPCSVGASHNTITSYKYTFKLLFKFLDEQHGLCSDKTTFAVLNYDALSGFLEWLETERNCSISTRNQRLAALSAFSVYAQNRNFNAARCFRREVSQIPAKKQRQKSRAIFNLEEVKLLLSLPVGKTKIEARDRVLLSVMYATGARAQEICDLTVADIRFGKESTTLMLKGKGGKYRHIGIPLAPSIILRNYIAARGIERQYAQFIFPSQTHAQMTVSCVEGIFKKYITLAKQAYPDLFREKNYSPHSMRHSTATHMLEAGVPLIVIKNFLGHSSLQTTQIYTEISQDTLDRHIKEWNKKWFSDCSSDDSQQLGGKKIPHFLL